MYDWCICLYDRWNLDVWHSFQTGNVRIILIAQRSFSTHEIKKIKIVLWCLIRNGYRESVSKYWPKLLIFATNILYLSMNWILSKDFAPAHSQSHLSSICAISPWPSLAHLIASRWLFIILGGGGSTPCKKKSILEICVWLWNAVSETGNRFFFSKWPIFFVFLPLITIKPYLCMQERRYTWYFWLQGDISAN